MSVRLEELGFDYIFKTLPNKILEKSSDSFLWVRLVLQQFENAYTDKDVEAILSNVPGDLFDLYSRMLCTLEPEPRKVKLARCVLKWTTLVLRPLKVQELQCAVELDMHETPHNMERLLTTVCGQLVTIDQSSNVHLIHYTVREFLVNDESHSELAVNAVQGHGHLAQICLKYLTGHVFKTLQPRLFQRADLSEDLSLLCYASAYLSDHLYKSNAADSALIPELVKFLKGNVLSWMEHIARLGDLQPLDRTAANLRSYLYQRAKYSAPMDPSFQIIEAWVVDFTRVTTMFGRDLFTCPSSVHHLIPPLCPSGSAIHKAFAHLPKSITILGHDVRQWDDCMTRIDFDGGQAT